jgi:hypothetical protein
MKEITMSVRMTVVLLAILVGFGGCATQTPFQWSQPAQITSNASFKLIEHIRERQGAFMVVAYRVEAVGFPVGKPLELWERNTIRSHEGKQGTVVVDQQGTVRWQSTDIDAPIVAGGLIAQVWHAATDPSKGKEVLIAHSKNLLGQHYEWALFEKESGQVAVAKIIPFPLIAEGIGGCHFSAELMRPDGMFLEITVEGFQTNEELSFTSRSDGEVIQDRIKFPSSGPLKTAYMPGVAGKSSGEATITFAGKECTVFRKLNWGQAALVVQ